MTEEILSINIHILSRNKRNARSTFFKVGFMGGRAVGTLG
jgi:hypothetical protein